MAVLPLFTVPPIEPQLYDLVSVGDVEAVLTMPNPTAQQEAILQGMISSASKKFLLETGYDLGALGTGPFAGVDEYNEWYDGNGSFRLFLKKRPIRSVTLLQVYNNVINLSQNWNQGGFVIDQGQSSISIRQGGGTTVSIGWPGFGGTFGCQPQSVNVQYTAGYDITPQDIQDAIVEYVVQNYKRWGSIDEATQQMTDLGTITYRSWEMTPRARKTFQDYRRVAVAY